MEDWDCECSEDFGACEEHRDVLAQREGASSRTADDLAYTFLLDVLVIADARESTVPAPRQLDSLRKAVTYWEDENRWTDNYGCRWVREEETSAGVYIHDDIPTAEGVLADLGLSVDWDDGYVISRIHPDSPLLADDPDIITCRKCGTREETRTGTPTLCRSCALTMVDDMEAWKGN